jgi:hypothetical protein
VPLTLTGAGRNPCRCQWLWPGGAPFLPWELLAASEAWSLLGPGSFAVTDAAGLAVTLVVVVVVAVVAGAGGGVATADDVVDVAVGVVAAVDPVVVEGVVPVVVVVPIVVVVVPAGNAESALA